MNDLTDLLKKVKRIEIRSRKLSKNMFAGEYHSAFKGKGMRFKEVREYMPGDDIRFIDWNVSARFGHPYAKVFEEERSLTVLLLLDVSGSMALGSQLRTKRETMIEMAGAIAFSALRNNDKVGAIFMTDGVVEYIAPAKGRNHILAILRKLLAVDFEQNPTNLNTALQFFTHLKLHASLCFLISDFYTPNIDKALKAIGAKHDGVALHIWDVLETGVPVGALLPLCDAENDQVQWVDTHSQQFRTYWKDQFEQRNRFLKKSIEQCGWGYLQVSTGEDFVPVLRHFLEKRIKHGHP